MRPKLFSVVRLEDGAVGTIVDIWKGGEAYEFEPDDHSDLDDGAPLTYAIRPEDIAEIIWSTDRTAD